jgi:dihydrofolate reductase
MSQEANERNTMRRVVLFQLLSLDGVAEEPSDWMFDGEALFDHVAEVIETQDTVLLGRHTYDYWVGHWPNQGPEPFRSFINGTVKHVFTSSPLDAEWDNTVVVSDPAADHVRTLKEQDGGDIGIHGSIELARSLLAEDLVDDLRLVVASSLATRGTRLFDGLDGLRRLDLVKSDRTEAGTLLLHYRTE